MTSQQRYCETQLTVILDASEALGLAERSREVLTVVDFLAAQRRLAAARVAVLVT